MAAYIPQPLRDLVRHRAGQPCEYCRSIEWLTHHAFYQRIPSTHPKLTPARQTQ